MPSAVPTVRAGQRSGPLLGVAAALLLPFAGLVLLVVRPTLDLRWQHHPAHFWLVMAAAALSAVLAWATGEAAARRGDARLLHVSLAFLSSAGFLLLHALATPGVLLAGSNLGFALATPIGVAIGSIFALRSTAEPSDEAVAREVILGRRLRVALLVLMLVWLGVSLAGLPPLGRAPTGAESLPGVVALGGVVLYLAAAASYARRWRHRREPMLFAVLAAYLLLAEALVAMALARSWHLSWWEWHVLLLTAFALVAVGARRSWRDERFGALYLEDTRAGRRDISVLFADLQAFTTYSEVHPPDEVSAMLDVQLGAAVPAVVRHGGEVEQIIGDALMVTFNTRGDQPDHAVRAARAGLSLQEATAPLAAAHPDWPRFRVGVNSGPVSLSLLGTSGGRTRTVIGDTVNTASRIEGQAPTGGVAVSRSTLERLDGARTRPLGQLRLKGRDAPVETVQVLALDEPS